jgi:hypothetical protein
MVFWMRGGYFGPHLEMVEGEWGRVNSEEYGQR